MAASTPSPPGRNRSAAWAAAGESQIGSWSGEGTGAHPAPPSRLTHSFPSASSTRTAVAAPSAATDTAAILPHPGTTALFQLFPPSAVIPSSRGVATAPRRTSAKERKRGWLGMLPPKLASRVQDRPPSADARMSPPFPLDQASRGATASIPNRQDDESETAGVLQLLPPSAL